jgi:hypothetical protein
MTATIKVAHYTRLDGQLMNPSSLRHSRNSLVKKLFLETVTRSDGAASQIVASGEMQISAAALAEPFNICKAWSRPLRELQNRQPAESHPNKIDDSDHGMWPPGLECTLRYVVEN